MQQVEVGFAPARRDKTKPGDEQEQRDEDDRGGEMQTQRMSPGASVRSSRILVRSIAWVMRVSIR